MRITVAADCAEFKTCSSCVNGTADCGWCLEEKKCSTSTDCKTVYFLKDEPSNCPRQPDPNFPFNETLARNWVLPLCAAAYGTEPNVCIQKHVPTATYYDRVEVVCDEFKKLGDNCSAYTSYDKSLQQIIVTFRGSAGKYEMFIEFLSIVNHKDDFFGTGKVYDYFHTAFLKIWQPQLQTQFRALRKVFPGYKVLVIGHSLGGALAALGAAYIAKVEGVPGKDIRLITFGEPRVGDKNFADYLETTIPSSYRVVHQLDPIPRLPPKLSIFDMVHHRTELWYQNDMTPGKKYDICPYQDLDGTCANTKQAWVFDDHTSYYHPPAAIPAWGRGGC
ncbi:unnamed protein product, partial [Mesorhabditis spiculigera]